MIKLKRGRGGILFNVLFIVKETLMKGGWGGLLSDRQAAGSNYL
jgi:hypothetical protein